MTIDNLISWLQEAEDNSTWLVSTQSVKRHLEKIKKTEQLNTQVVVGQSEQLNCPFCGSLNFQQITKSTDKCMDCQKCWEV